MNRRAFHRTFMAGAVALISGTALAEKEPYHKYAEAIAKPLRQSCYKKEDLEGIFECTH